VAITRAPCRERTLRCSRAECVTPPGHPPWHDGARWHISLHEAAGGEPLCLVLSNTRERRHAATPVERLNLFNDAIDLARRVRLLGEDVLARMEAHARRQPRAAQAELADLIALRESIYRIFASRARGLPAADADLDDLRGQWKAALAAVAIELSDGRLVASPCEAGTLQALRHHASASAVALLTSPLAERVRQCEDDRGCGRLFVDRTRNGSRRYCQSRECGNRARQAAFRARRRHAEPATGRDPVD
jgi:predicted RNA-binding Zn ribbon-like protein